MARKSFTLRKLEVVNPELGSYLQYPAGSEAASVGLGVRDVEDTQLRSDDLIPPDIVYDPIIPGSDNPKVAFFESAIVDYGEIELTWGAPLVASPSTASFEPTKVIITYSQLGEPQTIAEGTMLVNSNISSSLVHTVEPGKWAYYTLFVEYKNNVGEKYYERSATLSELAPFKYGCTDDMYSKIPEYYRELDSRLDEGNGGPLYRMLSVFGFEADRTRTTIDYLMSCKDPLTSNSEVLDTLAKDLSIDLTSEEIGASRLREILHSIGTLRRINGTPASLMILVQGILNSSMEFAVTNMGGKYILIHPQRINYLKDPNISAGARGSMSGGTPRTSTFALSVDADLGYISGFDAVWDNGNASVTTFSPSYDGGWASTSVFSPTYEGGSASVGYITETPTDIYDGGSPGSDVGGFDLDSFTTPLGDDEQWVYFPDPLSGGSVSVLQTAGPDVYHYSGETFYFSIHANLAENGQNFVKKVALYSAGEGAASAGYSGTSNDVLIAESSEPILVGNTKYWKLETMEMESALNECYLAIFIDSNVRLSTGFTNLLLERNLLGGRYFDGNTDTGGWLVDLDPVDRVSDYRWYDVLLDEIGQPEKSYSFYTSNYQKVKSVATRYLPRVLPVLEIYPKSGEYVYSNDMNNAASSWQIEWDVMPGAISQYPV